MYKRTKSQTDRQKPDLARKMRDTQKTSFKWKINEVVKLSFAIMI